MERSRPEAQYLQQALGSCLAEALSQVVLLQPQDPIEFLGCYLLHYRRLHPLSKPPPLPKTLPRTVAPIPTSKRAADTTSQSYPLLPHSTQSFPAPPVWISSVPPPSLSTPQQRTLGTFPRLSAGGEDVDPISYDYGVIHADLTDPELFVHMDVVPVLQQMGDILDDDDCFDNG